jgi:hypothetical protein
MGRFLLPLLKLLSAPHQTEDSLCEQRLGFLQVGGVEALGEQL